MNAYFPGVSGCLIVLISPMCKVKVTRVVRYSVRIQAILLIWLKVVKQAREPLGFFVKLRDDSQVPAGRDALATFDHSDIRGLVTA